MNQFLNLPTPIKIAASLIFGASLISIIYAFPTIRWILIIGLLTLGFIMGIYWLILRWLRNRKAAKMGDDISQHNTAAPSAISEPAARARLDDLRQNFSGGVQKFRAAGKNIYSLPWYCLVGEPGSGKTEAIRHSNVGFPPGLQDECQGVGGTINMNWWFTNHAIILDTAGRLLFEEVAPGTTNEWKEFLKLLLKNRPNQPINGLVLVIPGDSLIKDSAEEIEKKAGKIAVQLDEIQRVLDIRFPVFVLVTKCDLIHGFREFFENLTDPNLQHQILGWSNPDPLDSPFKPELVDEHLQGLIKRLQKRRLGIMQDPVPQDPGKKRIDEVDSFFDFPSALTSLLPRLRRYMEMVFVAGEWSQKPLFLRGIYFTSSMREGAAMDEELAKALGLAVDELPEERAWERDRAYFLRDTYTEKAFKEKFLVTRASNTKKLLRQRQMLLFGLGFCALLLILGFSWYGSKALREAIGDQKEYWVFAADKDIWNDGLWSPRIVSPRGDGTYSNNQQTPLPLMVNNQSTILIDYHARLKELTEQTIKVPWIFKVIPGLGSKVLNREEAHRGVFESGVLKPIIISSREKIIFEEEEKWTPELKGALTALLLLEGTVINDKSENKPKIEQITPLFDSLMVYLTDKNMDPRVGKIFTWIYSEEDGEWKDWPPPWLSAGLTLKGNKPIEAGVDKFFDYARISQSNQEVNLNLIKEIREALILLRKKENELARVAGSDAKEEVFPQKLTESFQDYSSAKKAVDDSLLQVREKGILNDEWFTLNTAYATQVGEAKRNIESTLTELDSIIEAQMGEKEGLLEKTLENKTVEKAATLLEEKENTLFSDIKSILDKEREQFEIAISSVLSDEEVTGLKNFDDLFLIQYKQDNEPVYQTRGNLYKACLSQIAEKPEDRVNLVGRLSPMFDEMRATFTRLRRRVQDYAGSYGKELRHACDLILDRAEGRRLTQLVKNYLNDAKSQLKQKIAFPLIFPHEDEEKSLDLAGLQEAGKLIRDIHNDLQDTVLNEFKRSESQLLKDFLAQVDMLNIEVFLSENDQIEDFKLSLPAYEDQRKGLTELVGESAFSQSWAGNTWRVVKFNNFDRKRTNNKSNLGEASLYGANSILYFYRYPDDDDSSPDREVNLSSDWPAFRLLHKRKAISKEDGKLWDVVLSIPSIGSEQGDLYLLLTIEFKNALPESQQDWPTYETLGLY